MNERDREIFGRNLTYYMNRNKVNGVTLAKYMNVSSATISDWMHGKKMRLTLLYLLGLSGMVMQLVMQIGSAHLSA